LKYATLPIEG